MYWSALPFAACFYLLFVPPAGLGEIGLAVWLFAFAALTRTAMTFYSVPYMAMGAELTQDYDERTLLAALRTVFQLIGMFAVLIGGNQIFFGATPEFANGQLNPAAYPAFALACLPFLLEGWAEPVPDIGIVPSFSVSRTRRSMSRISSMIARNRGSR